MTTLPDADDAQEREIQALADQLWGLLVDCTVEQKGMVLDRISALLAQEDASWDPGIGARPAHSTVTIASI